MSCPNCIELPRLFSKRNGLERWSIIPEYPTNYISSYGRWYNETSKVLRTPTYTDVKGNVRFKVYHSKGVRKWLYLHRLMGRLFLGVTDTRVHISHEDKNRLNNQLSNLRLTLM